MNPDDIFNSPPAAPVTSTVTSQPMIGAVAFGPQLDQLPARVEDWHAGPMRQAQHQQVVPNPNYLVQLAVEKDLDVDKLQRLIDMRMQVEAEEARKAFTRALAAFKKSAAPTILKEKHVHFTNKNNTVTEYDHATLAGVCKALSASLADYGFVASWNPKTIGPSRVSVTCILEHDGGHSREATLEADFDTSGGKNVIQGQGSAVSYLERYTLLAILGLATEGQDDDGRATAAANAEAIVGEKILDGLLAKLEKADTDEQALAVWRLGRDSVEATKNMQAVEELRQRVEARRTVLKQRRAA